MRMLLVIVGVAACSTPACAQLLPPTPYLCFDDSPFNGPSFGYFHLETFEDHLLNVPGVTTDRGGVTSVVFGPSIHDSVDCDDGVLDNSGLNGDSFFTSAGSAGIRFTFSAAGLGALPTHAGIVWTDGAGGTLVTFEAFDAAGVSLGAVNATLGDGSNNGTCAEDRFFGAIHPAGISAIRISHTAGGLEVDHLQYGGSGGANPCDADFNGDGDLNADDLSDYITCFFTHAAFPGACPAANFNGDANIDADDLSDYITAFFTGC